MSNPFEQDLLNQVSIYKDVVSKYVEPGQEYALLDFPNHSNIGDSIIYIGELEFFRKHVARKPSVVCDVNTNIESLKRLRMPEIIFLHGGGNFGDIWPLHQNFRNEIFTHFKNHKIIQLPQSIHFDDKENIEQTKRAISDQGNITLISRDQSSFEFLKKNFDCEIAIAPDSACLLNGIGSSRNPDIEVMAMLRTDRESAFESIREFLPENTLIADWNEAPVWGLKERIFNKLLVKSKFSSKLSAKAKESLYEHQARIRVNEGVEQLSGAKIILTDRLHVHLLCCLLGKPHIVLDNSYGKISKYMDAWETEGCAIRIDTAEHLPEAIKQINERLPV